MSSKIIYIRKEKSHLSTNHHFNQSTFKLFNLGEVFALYWKLNWYISYPLFPTNVIQWIKTLFIVDCVSPKKSAGIKRGENYL